MDDTPDVATLVAGLVSSSESARKYAVFKLQGLLADPSFADAFIQGDGLPALHSCVLESSGNAQAYALGSLLVLLELDVGWEVVDAEVVEKVSYAQGTWSETASQEEHALIIHTTAGSRARRHPPSGQHRPQRPHAARPSRQPPSRRRLRLCDRGQHRLRRHQTRPGPMAHFPGISGPTTERLRSRPLRQRTAPRQCPHA